MWKRKRNRKGKEERKKTGRCTKLKNRPVPVILDESEGSSDSTKTAWWSIELGQVRRAHSSDSSQTAWCLSCWVDSTSTRLVPAFSVVWVARSDRVQQYPPTLSPTRTSQLGFVSNFIPSSYPCLLYNNNERFACVS